MKLRLVIILVTLVLAVGFGSVIYLREVNRLQEPAKELFQVRASLIERYTRILRHNVEILARTIERRHRNMNDDEATSSVLGAVRYYPDLDTWGWDSKRSGDDNSRPRGTLLGGDRLQSPKPSIRNKLMSVLDTDYQFQALIENVPDVQRVQFISADRYVYSVPGSAIEETSYSKILNNKPIWSVPLSSARLGESTVLSPVYMDPSGGEPIVSIMMAVEMGGQFSGVVAADISINTLREMVEAGHAAGRSILVDENGKIVARRGDFPMHEYHFVPPSSAWLDQGEGALWLSQDVAEGELRLLHQLPKDELYWSAARSSLPFWIVLAGASGFIFLSVRLRWALSEVSLLMNRDPLTGLLNRRGFITISTNRREIARKKDANTALLTLDLDGFKSINDTHGHEIGDEALVAISQRLAAGIKEYDLFARWGGEELLILLIYDDASVVKQVAERLRESVASQVVTKQDLTITVSGGLVTWEMDEALESAVSRADDLLYRAKERGRNRIESGVR